MPEEEITVHEEKDDNGKLIRTVSMKGNTPHGETVIYDANGNVAYKINYVDGILSGPAEFFSNGLPLTINDYGF